MAKLIRCTDRPPTVAEAELLLGGPVEVIHFSSGIQLLVNEDGIALDLPLNPEASVIFGAPILGDAILLRGKACWS